MMWSSTRHVLLVASLIAVEARADERRTALVAGSPDTESVVRLVADELRAMGQDVEVAPRDSDVGHLRARARAGDKSTVVVVGEHDVEVTVVVADAPRTQHVPRTTDDDPGTTALAVAEVVRAELAHVDASGNASLSAPVADSGAAVADRPAAVARARGSITTHVGLGALLGAGGIPTQPVVTLGGGWWITRRLALEANAFVGLPGANLPTSEPVWTTSLGLGAGYAILARAERVTVTVGGGAAGAMLVYRDDNKRQLTGAVVPFVHGDARIRIGYGFDLRLDGTGGAALPTTDLKLKSGERATFGLPFVALSAGLERSW